MKKTKIDFKFKSNWTTFQKWFDKKTLDGVVIPWSSQREILEMLFNKQSKNINWTQLWKEHSVWFEKVKHKKGQVLWTEQKRQIETLLLNQAGTMDAPIWTILIKDIKGRIVVHGQDFTHNVAMKIKKELEGDENGVGGLDHIDQVAVVNLNSLF